MSDGGGGTSTTTTQQGPPQQFLNAYSNINNQAQNVASQPLQQYGGNIVAGLSPDQQGGITGIQNAQGAANPFINAAAQEIGQSTNPLAPSLAPYANQATGLFSQAPGAAEQGQQASAGLFNQMPTAAAAAGMNPADALYNASAQQLRPTQFSAGQVGQYESPYTKQVVGATQAEFANQNAQQNAGIVGNSISSGAFGGDRTGVAQGIAAGQEQLAQAPVIAGLENQGYAQALQEFNQQQQVGLGAQQATQQLEQGAGAGLLQGAGQYLGALQGAGQGLLAGSGQVAGALQGAGQGITGVGGQMLGANQAQDWLASQAGFGMANLGNEAQNTALQGAQAQLGVGGLEQQVAQEQLNVPYQQFIQQQAYPFQTTGFQANIAEGLGGASGGTSSTSVPGPSPVSQAAGLGLTGAGIYSLLGGSSGFGSGAGGIVDSGAWAARGGAIPHRDMGGDVPVPTGVPDLSMSIVPGANGMGVPPSHPGKFNLNTNTGTTSTTKGGGGGLLNDILPAALIGSHFLGGGGQVPERAIGGIMPFPAHQTRMPGTGRGITSNDNFMPHIGAPRLAVGGITGGNGVIIPQLSTSPGGGGMDAVNAYLNANKGGQPHPAAAPPAAAPPAGGPAAPPAAAPPGPPGAPGPTGNAPPGTQFGIHGVLPATPSDAWLAYQQANPFFNVGGGAGGGGGGGGNARGGVVGRDVGGATPDQEVGPGIPGSTYDPAIQEWLPPMPSDPMAGMPMTPRPPGAMTALPEPPGGGGGGAGRPTGPPPPPPSRGIMARNLPPPPPPPSTASDIPQGAGIVPAPAAQQQDPWDLTPQTSGQQQGEQPPPGHDRSHVGETLLAMGLGMMGGSSPFAGVNIGRGGEQGLQFGEQMRLREEQGDIRKMQVQELADYRKQMTQGRSDQLSERAQTAASQQEIERQRLAQSGQTAAGQQDIERQRLAQGKYTWSSGMGPDPNDPSKQVSGMYRLPTTGTEQPQFIAGQTLTAKSQSSAAALPPDVTKMLAQQVMAGDNSGMTGLGYGTAGAQARIAVKTEVAQQLAAQGHTGADLAAKTAEYMGERAGARTAGTREANVGMAVNEAQNFMPLALQASQNVNRTQFPTINSVLQAYEKGTGDENIVRLAVATNSLTNAYSRAITPSGIPTEGNQQRARDLLDKAWSQGQYATAVDQLWKEMQAAKASPIQVRQEQQGRISGRDPNAGATAPSLTSPATPQWQHDAVGPNGVHVYSNDGKSWFDISGKPFQPAGP